MPMLLGVRQGWLCGGGSASLDDFPLLKLFFFSHFLRSLYKLIRGRLEKRIARIVSSNKASMSARTKGRAPHEAHDNGVTSRPRVKHTRT